jgi:hypothetical protein
VTYGLDVVVRVGWRRQHDHRTMNEIGQELRALGIQITDREVERLWDYYRLLLRGLSQTDLVKLREAEKTYGGLVWSADGLQPGSGQPQLWVVREVLTRTVVHAEWLCQVDEPTLKTFLQPVKALGLKALATVSDQQRVLVKALSHLAQAASSVPGSLLARCRGAVGRARSRPHGRNQGENTWNSSH